VCLNAEKERGFVNQYSVELWINNQGDIPDYSFAFLMNVVLEPDELVKSALFLSCQRWVREVSIEFLFAGRWSVIYARSSVALAGAGMELYDVVL
jgi:hypothetical protein